MKNCINVFFFSMLLMIVACGTPSPHVIDKPGKAAAEDRIIGKWKHAEDTNKLNFYAITKAGPEFKYQYHVKFWNRGGTNPTYEANIHFSAIDGQKFINVPYWEKVTDSGNINDWVDRGYFFLRIMEANPDFSRITTATVNDPRISSMKNSRELKLYISKNLSNPKFYSDTAHFYKVDE